MIIIFSQHHLGSSSRLPDKPISSAFSASLLRELLSTART